LEERKAFSAASLNDGDTEHSETGTGTEQLADA
jgi:hypothetical protein